MARAKWAIQEVYGDTSVPPQQTVVYLKALREEIDELLQDLKDDGFDIS